MVDDVVDNLLLVKFILESEGYHVALATGGCSALTQIRAAPPALVLLDVMMPDMSGLAVTQHLRQLKDCLLLPIILVTADRNIDFDQAVRAGANNIIFKPLDMDELLATVSRWCC